ncbi:MAG: PAS domain S-box protein [Candidatus Binatia bacterium]
MKDYIMTRTMEGRINVWNPSAEQLYGWGKEDAIGSVSHDLLRTQFPKPLKEIESELVKKGRWEGKLVHATRDGARIVVESRWILDLAGQPGTVVEINAPSNGYHVGNGPGIARHGRRAISKFAKANDLRSKSASILRSSFLVLFVCLACAWVVYLSAGHRIIEWLSTIESPSIIDQWLEGRRVTPLANYYQLGDALLVYGTLRIVAVYGLLVLLITAPSGVLLLGLSSLLTSLALFSALEIAPSLIRPLRLDVVSPYHAYKASYLYDEELAYRERPFNRIRLDDFRGSHYSPSYNLDVPPRVVDWEMDEYGFRNSRTTESAEIVAVGDSFFEFGDNVGDTFVSRLAIKLNGTRVTNLSKSGYGPFQYLEAFKRFGVKLKPKYALFGFYEGNDIGNIRDYRVWKSGAWENAYVFLRFSQSSFLRRYWAAMETAATSIKRSAILAVDLILDKVARNGGYAPEIHPKLALLNLGERGYERMLFVDRLNTTDSPDEMLKTDEWRALEQILIDLKKVSVEHGIVPIIVYVPAAAHIYAQFSTDASGPNWLQARDQQIAAKKNTAAAVKHLSQKLGIDVIDLSPPLEAVAKEKLLYHRLDSHWTSDGRDIAASFVAGSLQERYLSWVDANESN